MTEKKEFQSPYDKQRLSKGYWPLAASLITRESETPEDRLDTEGGDLSHAPA